MYLGTFASYLHHSLFYFQELQQRIVSTQDERDKMLRNIAGTRGSPAKEQITKIKVSVFGNAGLNPADCASFP